jgi:hypothetical protein
MVCGLLGALLGCPQLTVERNPFLGYTDEYGVAGQQQATQASAAAGAQKEEIFRQKLTLTFVNTHPGAILETSFIAWVMVSSIRSADQQDALLRNGYVQLARAVNIGTAFELPVGTFVYDGPGTAGATPVKLAPGQGPEGETEATVAVTPTTAAFELVTPDTILVFSQPPVSCDSVAFTFSDPVTGEVLSGPSTLGGLRYGGYKTLAEVDVYECSPLRPGLFFSGSGALRPNEFREGDPITFTSQAAPTAGGAFATVSIGATQQAATGGP